MSGRAVAIVQVRLGSRRLPDKVLLPIAGRSVVEHVAERLAAVAGLDAVVFATPAGRAQAPLHTHLRACGLVGFAWDGAPNDLLGRYLATARTHGAERILMVDGDCPLLDPDTCARMLAALADAPDAEYVRIAPAGIEGGVACLRRSTFERIEREGATGAYREHATLRILREPEAFRIVDIPPDPAFADPADAHRFWLDTPDDLRFLRCVFDRLGPAAAGKPVDLREVVALLRREPRLRAINAHVDQKDPFFDSPLVAVLTTPDPQGARRSQQIARALTHAFHFGVRCIEDAARRTDERGEPFEALVALDHDPRAHHSALPVFRIAGGGAIDAEARRLQREILAALRPARTAEAT